MGSVVVEKVQLLIHLSFCQSYSREKLAKIQFLTGVLLLSFLSHHNMYVKGCRVLVLGM